ncbi:VHS and GAT domain-containing protein [Phanerochaete sordida]|uniref:VHS and GAT domain-containing protein n=1 Tax=Phanerochaete sordida TaxID=48140 RepID=A0A9P3GAU2_9APHY|nr:VHS and GAT domain-containing protein [Phanerochaete sordida]
MFPTTTTPWLAQETSPLKTLIARATYPSQPEPNYALNLEVAEYVNQKKANTPREAAMTIAQLVNHRNPHVAMLALALLDTLVQSCGYPFQLQIATKEFLNELVRRFPERPPPFPGPVMSKILELIHGWKEGICVESRFKDDLGNIRDMHRLLTFKGYRFRDVPRSRNNVTVEATSNLKTAEELENEDREAQQAKLQELIRRGTPRDLAQAQELMKSLAGANPDAKPDYRTQALTELNKLESKVILLNEMLDNVDTTRGERFAQGDVYDQVASILKSARPKIQGWISNAETDDPESLDTFLHINDQINTVLDRYEAFKRGDYAAAANPVPRELGGQATQGVSLIDFDDSAPASNPTTGGGGNTIDELAELFGPGANSAPQPAQQQQPIPIQQQIQQIQQLQQQQPPAYGAPQQQQQQYAQPNANLFAQLGMGGSGTSTPMYSPQPTGGAVNAQARPQFASTLSHGLTAQRTGSSTGMGTPPAQGALRLGSPSPNYLASSNTGSANGFGAPAAGSSAGLGLQPMPAQPPQPPAQPAAQGQQGKDPFADLVGLF